jgi:hypothetical protein
VIDPGRDADLFHCLLAQREQSFANGRPVIPITILLEPQPSLRPKLMIRSLSLFFGMTLTLKSVGL